MRLRMDVGAYAAIDPVAPILARCAMILTTTLTSVVVLSRHVCLVVVDEFDVGVKGCEVIRVVKRR